MSRQKFKISAFSQSNLGDNLMKPNLAERAPRNTICQAQKINDFGQAAKFENKVEFQPPAGGGGFNGGNFGNGGSGGGGDDGFGDGGNEFYRAMYTYVSLNGFVIGMDSEKSTDYETFENY